MSVLGTALLCAVAFGAGFLLAAIMCATGDADE